MFSLILAIGVIYMSNSELTMNTGYLKVKNSQGNKSRVPRDHSIPAGNNISHQLHVAHKSSAAAS